MILYRWDEQGYYISNPPSVEVDDAGALPERSTPTKPPKLTGTQVAQWQGQWVKMASRPSAPDPVPLPSPVPDWMALIAARRWIAETGGIVLGGMPVDTDDRSKLLINGAALRASRDGSYVLKWKTLEGFVDLPADQVLIMADAVSDHVQDCFNREAELQAAVVEGTIAAEMLEQGWPTI
ncbi:DUF4376 domain-containing protein [Pseudomonas sp. CDFA 602]|uniref:DUF4376 domain-containing protein n=1 Tax=Pseudomonas californiensis TaxID=2829823 RepID=UPI001E2D0253|nr:DUF4376 domain-containing protein [Pseudomonas californiensis]MCD5996514.1 DUF4376 domain-containing protein [Pseudomonas californiensis]MCD6002113.1 DUF4376 domain-containing protein [Pseudomonas californiensis]